MIDCVLLPEPRSSSSVGFFYHLPAIQTLLVCLCVYICAICSLKMADDECRANLYHSCSTAATAPASTLQGKNKHAHTHTGSSTALLPTQSYLPIKLNFSLHLLKMVRCSLSFYLSPSLSLCFLSPPADCPGGDWWELWWDEAGCTHVSLSHVSGPAVSWAHPSGFGCTGRGNMYTQIQKYSQKHTLTTASPACCQCSKPNLPRYCVRLKTTYAILISSQIFCGEFLCEIPVLFHLLWNSGSKTTFTSKGWGSIATFF